jgi:hypothetical protein
MRAFFAIICLLLAGCSSLTVSPLVDVEHGTEVIWMDDQYERGQIPSDWQLGIRPDGVVVARKVAGERYE